MAWQNAPVLNKLTASQQGGNRGAQIWGVDFKGKLYTCYQTSPGGSWSDWKGGGWNDPNEPKAVYELAASQSDPDGRVYFFALDTKYELWARWQTSPGGSWLPWRKNFHPLPGTSKARKLAAVRDTGKGHQLFAITESGYLAHTTSIPSKAEWSPWLDMPYTPDKSRFIEVTACQQKDGRAAVWALDEKRQLWGAGQETAGGKWGPWVGPNWLGAPKLRNIAAVEGQNGAVIVGQTEDYQVTSNFQNSAGSNSWRGWSTPFKDDPRSYELTAAGQNNGIARIWAVTMRGTLTSLQQKEAAHLEPDWSDKDSDSNLPTPPVPSDKVRRQNEEREKKKK